MSDPNNVPLPQQPEANGTPTPNPVPQYGAPAPAQPAYGQPAYGQPAPTANSYGQAVPTYGQPAPDANTYGQSAPAYGTPAPDGNPYGPVPPSYGQYAAPTATVPLDKPYYGCSFQKPSCASGRSTRCSRAARPAVNSGGGCWPLSASI